MKNKPTKVEQIIERALRAKEAASRTVTAHRNLALSFIAEALSKSADKICAASEQDVALAKKNGADEEEAEKLRLDHVAIGAMSGMILNLSSCDDPADRTETWQRENGITVTTKRVPLGIVLVLCGGSPKKAFEVAAMCLKAGNAALVMRSSETPNTDKVLFSLLGSAFACCGIDADCVMPVRYEPDTLGELLKRDREIDALLLMGGKGLNSFVRANTKIPIIESSTGTVHIYVDEGADIRKAAQGIIASATSSLPSSVSCVLVNWMISDELLPTLDGLAMAAGVELSGDARVRATLHGISENSESSLSSPHAGNVSLITVNSLEMALEHIANHGDGICECIYSENENNISKFCAQADAGVISVNSSPSHANGYDVGFGGDLGISANKLRSRGPLGLNRLTTVKYIIKG